MRFFHDRKVRLPCQFSWLKLVEQYSCTGVSSFSTNLAKQSVVITSVLPAAKLQEALESTGKRAVILGLGSQTTQSEAAVAMLGGVVGAGSVQGVVRFVQVLCPETLDC